MKKTINYYVKDRRARFLIKFIAAVGYVALGFIWWILYGFVTVLHYLTCEVIETLFVFVEGLSAARYKLRQIHKHFSYFEMFMIFLGFITMMVAMVSLLWIVTIIVPAGY
jgi:hypothetical protein